MFEMRYYNTYYYANFISNLLKDPFDYLRTLHEQFEDDGVISFCEPFPRQTALHQFTTFCLELEFHDDLSGEACEAVLASRDRLLGINHAMKAHGIEHTTLAEWLAGSGKKVADADANDLYDYFNELRLGQSYEDLMTRLADEVFFILFLNRELLFKLNAWVAIHVRGTELDRLEVETQALFERPGVLKRQTAPKWAKRAVFFRDRGACVFCNRDLTGLVAIDSPDNYDHIIPLADGGLNDVTNLQLLCETCNRKKGYRRGGTSSRYERWFRDEE